jgi:hypothetical protein
MTSFSNLIEHKTITHYPEEHLPTGKVLRYGTAPLRVRQAIAIASHPALRGNSEAML